MDIKIVRCLWGNKKKHEFTEKNVDFYHNECSEAKVFDDKFNLKNQIVFVWDNVNKEHIEKLGYPYFYMGDSLNVPAGFDFYHKLLGLQKSMELYDEILFLDWDFMIQKELDDVFHKLLRDGNDIQIPLYFYPDELLKPFEHINAKCNNGMHYFNMLFYNIVRYCKWKFDNGLVIPNAGFIYCRDKNFFNQLIEIQKVYGITSNIEELCAMIYLNNTIKTTREYVNKIEPVVCNGREDKEMEGKQALLNAYTMEILNKNIYFKHK